MRFGSVFAKAVLVVLAGSLALASGCSKSTSPKTNNTGGGGGVTGPTFNFSFPTNGISHSVTFPDAGTFTYQCSIHGSAMSGTVVVDPASANTSQTVSVGANSGGVPGLVFSPNSVTITPGGQVTFQSTNENTGHTATR